MQSQQAHSCRVSYLQDTMVTRAELILSRGQEAQASLGVNRAVGWSGRWAAASWLDEEKKHQSNTLLIDFFFPNIHQHQTNCSCCVLFTWRFSPFPFIWIIHCKLQKYYQRFLIYNYNHRVPLIRSLISQQHFLQKDQSGFTGNLFTSWHLNMTDSLGRGTTSCYRPGNLQQWTAFCLNQLMWNEASFVFGCLRFQ